MDPTLFESSHVHSVYNAIASDFSRTRHSRWPFVEQFLESLPSGSLILDAGTGNGKYLGVRSVLEWQGKREDLTTTTTKGKGKEGEKAPLRNDVLNVGFDMSQGLLGIASGKGHEVVRGDCVDMTCWRRGAFNHAISIATIHHFATPSRRIESIKQMILSILPSSPPSTSTQTSQIGRILIVVWSSEQDPSLLGARSARRTTGGKKGAIEIEPLKEEEGEMKGKDVFVPWEKQAEPVPRKKKEPTPRRRNKPNTTTTASEITTREEEKDESVPSDKLSHLNLSSPPNSTPSPPPTLPPDESTLEEPKPTFNRYYHLFTQFELSSLVRSAALELDLSFECPLEYPLEPVREEVTAEGNEEGGGRGFVRLKEERWERENWVVELEVGWREKE